MVIVVNTPAKLQHVSIVILSMLALRLTEQLVWQQTLVVSLSCYKALMILVRIFFFYL